MSKRVSDLPRKSLSDNSTFHFDSQACRVSRDKSAHPIHPQVELDFSQATSEIMRYAEVPNQNILQLFESSEEDKKTSKAARNNKNELWDFFARFEKQSNPDITISDIELPFQKHPKPSRKLSQSQNVLQDQLDQLDQVDHNSDNNRQEPKQEKEGEKGETKNPEGPRYPKRNRIGSLRYWMGERCVYKSGQIVAVIRPDAEPRKHPPKKRN